MVNAANRRMRGGGGVDGAIHRAGGPGCPRRPYARFPHGLATGDAGWTTAGAMPARWVIHVVGPVYGKAATARELLSPTAAPLEVADEPAPRPSRSHRVGRDYGWPREDAGSRPVGGSRRARRRSPRRLVAFDETTPTSRSPPPSRDRA